MEDFRLVVMQFKLRDVVVQENFRLALFKTNKESLFAEQGRCTKRSVYVPSMVFNGKNILIFSRQKECCEI